MSLPTPKLEEIANRIHSHLLRFAADPAISHKNNLTRFWLPVAWHSGRYVGVCYVKYQSSNFLTKPQALGYLKWLDAGNVGRHFKWQQEMK